MKVPSLWDSKNLLSTMLLPLSKLYTCVANLNKSKGLAKSKLYVNPVPVHDAPEHPALVHNALVLVVGNINVGGTGKTPVILALITFFKENNINVGVISRGYARKSKGLVIASQIATAADLGDEPFLIYTNKKVPLVVCNDRVAALNALLSVNPHLDLVLSDDGLQHYALARTIEIAVVGLQGFGNARIFPSGPLREHIYRLESVDYILSSHADPYFGIELNSKSNLNSKTFYIKQQLSNIYKLDNPHISMSLEDLARHQAQDHVDILALAGIAYPARFFDMLSEAGIICRTRSFSDHYNFKETDFKEADFEDDLQMILMTEKDAVKCHHLNLKNAWVVPLISTLPADFLADCLSKIKIAINK